MANPLQLFIYRSKTYGYRNDGDMKLRFSPKSSRGRLVSAVVTGFLSVLLVNPHDSKHLYVISSACKQPFQMQTHYQQYLEFRVYVCVKPFEFIKYINEKEARYLF